MPMRYIISFLCATATIPAAGAGWAEVPRVMVDIPPIHALVAQVMGDLGQPDLLLAPGASEHDFQLRPSQAAALADADLVVWVGPDLTPWLERALNGLEGTGTRLPLLGVPGTLLQDYATDGAAKTGEAHDHAEHGHDAQASGEHGHDEHGHDDHEHEGHGHAGLDPHAWLDPANAQLWLAGIATELSRIDPEHAATYQANAAAAAAGIATLDAEITATLAPARQTPLFMQHQAYGYFAAHYGLTIGGSLSAGDATAPGAGHLADLRDVVAGAGVACLFPEAQHDPDAIAQLATETGTRLGGALDPVGSTLTPGPMAYADLMRGLAGTIAACATGG